MFNEITENKLKVTTQKDGIIFLIKVIPGSSRSEISGMIDDELKIKLSSQPVEGKANKECIKLLSKLLKVPKTSIEIISGDTNKHKKIFIKGNADELTEKLQKLLM